MTKIHDPSSAAKPGIDRPLRLGTRQSPLALAQAEMTAKALVAAHRWSADQVELVPMIASGDRILDRSLADAGGKALWTKELDRSLAAGEIDCAVHSMKDVETIRPEEFVVAAMLERADIHDRLVGAENIDALPHGAIVGTASPRRKAQLLRQRDDLDIRLIRGNVQTRLAKIAAGEYAASLLAAAGLDRLGMDDIGTDISDELMLPAPAQGAIGIETLREAQAIRDLLSDISCSATFQAVMAERAFLAELTADCHSPVAANAVVQDTQLCLRAEILLPDGSESVSDSVEFANDDKQAPARLANSLLGRASAELKAVFGR
ncbi:hydroxymethylbilane synthase [Parasphingorhabdus marina DSM 22363]|uniref:Hydroxymethylbilane synthase n=1 Tax=Parasphingorhabdus marina DSM 22363 TaxID=1123272 RepID=A0A1N6CZM5_9SPHN|nr:hydroxymethylbilane synthase [Parasphingorhabdus marina]SIN63939.1 hydroxymethylbilane synthase [Parasphingorhabdus marina DSM 22363]